MLDWPASATAVTWAARASQPIRLAAMNATISQCSRVMLPCAMALSRINLMMYGPASEVAVMTPMSSSAMSIWRP